MDSWRKGISKEHGSTNRKVREVLEKYKGPFEIIERVAENVYKIKMGDGHEDLVSAGDSRNTTKEYRMK